MIRIIIWFGYELQKGKYQHLTTPVGEKARLYKSNCVWIVQESDDDSSIQNIQYI